MCDLSMKQTRRTPCRSLRRIAQLLPGEVYSCASSDCASSSLSTKVAERTTVFRLVNPPVQTEMDGAACPISEAIRASLSVAARLFQIRTQKDSRVRMWDNFPHTYGLRAVMNGYGIGMNFG